MRKLLAILIALAFLLLVEPAGAQALQSGWERGTPPTILGVPKCIATKAAVRIYGVPKTKPGQVCAVRVWATEHRGNMTVYERANRATSSWEYLGLLSGLDPSPSSTESSLSPHAARKQAAQPPKRNAG